jgi:hypothetical protein
MGRPEARLKAALGFVKAREMISTSAPDTWTPGCLVTAHRDSDHPGIVVVHLDRVQGSVSFQSNLSTAIAAFRDQEVEWTPLLHLHLLVRARVKAAMERFKTVTLAEVESFSWLNTEIAKSLEIIE